MSAPLRHLRLALWSTGASGAAAQRATEARGRLVTAAVDGSPLLSSHQN
jgi:hypothetical protein